MEEFTENVERAYSDATKDANPKALNYLKRQENDFTSRLCSALSVLDRVGRELVKPYVRALTAEYMQTGEISDESFGDLVGGEPVSRGFSIVVKDSTQIKSATDNIGTFDGSNSEYQPDSLSLYLSRCDVVYDKKKMNGKYRSGSGRVVTRTYDMPFIQEQHTTSSSESQDFSEENQKNFSPADEEYSISPTAETEEKNSAYPSTFGKADTMEEFTANVERAYSDATKDANPKAPIKNFALCGERRGTRGCAFLDGRKLPEKLDQNFH